MLNSEEIKTAADAERDNELPELLDTMTPEIRTSLLSAECLRPSSQSLPLHLAPPTLATTVLSPLSSSLSRQTPIPELEKDVLFEDNDVAPAKPPVDDNDDKTNSNVMSANKAPSAQRRPIKRSITMSEFFTRGPARGPSSSTRFSNLLGSVAADGQAEGSSEYNIVSKKADLVENGVQDKPKHMLTRIKSDAEREGPRRSFSESELQGPFQRFSRATSIRRGGYTSSFAVASLLGRDMNGGDSVLVNAGSQQTTTTKGHTSPFGISLSAAQEGSSPIPVPGSRPRLSRGLSGRFGSYSFLPAGSESSFIERNTPPLSPPVASSQQNAASLSENKGPKVRQPPKKSISFKIPSVEISSLSNSLFRRLNSIAATHTSSTSPGSSETANYSAVGVVGSPTRNSTANMMQSLMQNSGGHAIFTPVWQETIDETCAAPQGDTFSPAEAKEDELASLPGSNPAATMSRPPRRRPPTRSASCLPMSRLGPLTTAAISVSAAGNNVPVLPTGIIQALAKREEEACRGELYESSGQLLSGDLFPPEGIHSYRKSTSLPIPNLPSPTGPSPEMRARAAAALKAKAAEYAARGAARSQQQLTRGSNAADTGDSRSSVSHMAGGSGWNRSAFTNMMRS
ncbi:hypothetical protein CEUSTIGMA_g11363.t1 [Chlamydomonas eustigma]|uniref:Uncharacterized protein n=1 Tax=Chlamydomonas eustigma TaxID=1157962 RepID=A0A250XLY1_9CHLO|nr:hypothetical protein CEUSTIGMA_g11363.t1 [Chlamydomonas eustigma]|eukprot:GAX83939.1 hypothetical protein CEUSTIGMA_g11363.t1 [Chlamydomonas eustigma]